MIRAVVFDIGGVLEVNDDALFPGPWCEAHGISPADLKGAFARLPAGPAVRGLTDLQIQARVADDLALTEQQSGELWRDYWRWYVGELDRPLHDWFAGLPGRGFRTGILSNSGPGAREHERIWGFEELVDILVYSHEVGIEKPDPAIYALAQRELGVEAHEILFLDDWEPAVTAARASGWRALLHTGDTPATLRALESALTR